MQCIDAHLAFQQVLIAEKVAATPRTQSDNTAANEAVRLYWGTENLARRKDAAAIAKRLKANLEQLDAADVKQADWMAVLGAIADDDPGILGKMTEFCRMVTDASSRRTEVGKRLNGSERAL